MRLAKVIGKVTLARQHQGMGAASLRVVQPLSADHLAGRSEPGGDFFVAFDQLGSGLGQIVAISEGREASQPFYPEVKPIDAYVSALIDEVTLHESSLPPAKPADSGSSARESH